ncbi:hypothetical protein LTR49_006484 [Elasticomyces elasticus]|nr:hypothetical protein LTR49_006484 [Elasticomyces elasticus]
MRSRAFPYLLILPVFSSALFTRSQCYDGIFTLVSRGSEEPQGQSVLETIAGGIAAALPGSGSNEVVYPALLSFWDSAPIGVTNAQQQLQDYYEQCPNGKIVLLGYSQGSYVLTTTLAGGNYSGQSWSPLASNIAENIAAIVLFGDQSRMLGQGTLATGTNCATTCTATAPLALKSPYSTSMQVYFDRLEEWCDADDPICCSTGNDIQAHLSYWSTNTTDTVVQFVQDLTMQPYQYSRLSYPDQGSGEAFRLLLLHPSLNQDVPLQCTIQHHDLARAPPYEALSYVWGTDDCQVSIYCQGNTELRARYNLKQALLSLRLLHQPRTLWIDAFCINQGDDDERAQQVMLMRTIYSQAHRVIVWLGDRTPDVEHALRLATNLRQVSLSVASSPADHHASFWDTTAIRTLAAAEGLFAIGELADLFDRPWFTRIWCVQEVVASSAAVARCGDLEIPFADIVGAASIVHKFRDGMVTGRPLEFWNTVALQKYAEWPLSPREGSIGVLEKALMAARDFESTDPRDKVFALLGLVSESKGWFVEPSSIDSIGVKLIRQAASTITQLVSGKGYTPKQLKIDYRKSVMEVYRDVTRFILRKAPRVADILCQAHHLTDPGERKYWPSWVPDWSRKRNTAVLGGMGVFTADDMWLEQEDKGLSPTHHDTLFLGGFGFDRIIRVTEVLECDIQDALELDILWLQLFDIAFLESWQEPYPLAGMEETRGMAFLRTVMVGELGLILYDGLMGELWSAASATNTLKLPRDYTRAENDGSACMMNLIQCDHPGMARLAQKAQGGIAAHFDRIAKSLGYGRRLFLTEYGRLGLGPRVSRPGDAVTVLYGGRMPFVLRQQGAHHLLIGDAYLRDDAIMSGSVSKAVRGGQGVHHKVTFEIR